jgi:hypothetical protein
MAKEWISALRAKGAAWNIAAAQITELEGLAQSAETALAAAASEATRTPVATAACRAAFGALVSFMRDIKKRYFYEPPLAGADMASLGLKPRDTAQTPAGTPTAQVTVETFLVGRHELGVKIAYVTGSPDDRANKGYRIWYSVTAQGEPQPANPDDLRKSFFTKRKKDVMEFEFGDSGKACWMAAQVENDGRAGPWGPMASALIP